MQVNVAGLRRNIKNLAHNYSDAQVKVREATSNDPWGPSSTLMSEIADLTYNVVAFTEIMQMIWKRLNDHGRNWRHVYKALVLLEYLIKTGSEKVAQQCKENIFAIQTLKDFQYFEEIKDQGLNVREKAKQLVQLLKDDERLRNERARALKAKERFAQAASGFGSDGGGNWSSSDIEAANRELETARPQTVGEEELQLQLALAMSREEAEQEEQRRRSDDVRLQLALSQSEEEFKTNQVKPTTEKQSHVLDLLDVNLGIPASPSQAGATALDPWGFPQAPPPQSPPVRPQNDPWGSPVSVPSVSSAPSPSPVVDPWTPVSHAEPVHKPGGTPDPFDLSLLEDPLMNGRDNDMKKTPHSFLGENSALVNLDNLVTVSKSSGTIPMSSPALSIATANPFTSGGASVSPQPNLFQQQQQQQQQLRPSMNQMRQQPFVNNQIPMSDNVWGPPAVQRPIQTPLMPSAQPNPFLS